MYQSSLLSKTSKESVSDADSANAELLVRAGFIHKTMAGAYSYLPLGNRVLQKIEQIVREEMNKVGAEIFMTALCPEANWKQTGRLETVDVLFSARAANEAGEKLNGASYVLCGTHEEVVTPLVKQFVHSYQDLPCAVYQIQTKFRNEARPKSGILRGREFRMKDLYSFHASEEDMTRYFHEEAAPAYRRIMKRLGIDNETVEAWASGGSFSKQPSLEFQTKCATGEDLIFHSKKTDTYYNREIAPCRARPWNNDEENPRKREDVTGKGIIGVEELVEFLKLDDVRRTTKTLLFETDDGRVIAAAVRGDYDVNEDKLRGVVKCKELQLASAETVKKVTGAEVGYAGPIGLPDDVEVYWDDSCANRKNFECGANKTDEHSINVNFGRDVNEPDTFHDFKVAKEGDIDPESGKPYETFSAAEVGNLFTLYTKFSDAFGMSFTDKDGKAKTVYMGCYGIGTTRLLGVIAETHNDEHGLKWPEHVAPFQVHIIPIAKKRDEEAYEKALKLHDELEAKGIEVLLDDRLKESVGSRLADADLIGIPHRVVISRKTLAEQSVELKERGADDTTLMELGKIVERLAA